MTEAEEQWRPDLYELSAGVVLWRGDEILILKRAVGVATGGWFFPGGHVDPGERPIDACVRELVEETGIQIGADALRIFDVMSYETNGSTSHSIHYNAACPGGAEPRISDEHSAARWMTPEAYIARSLGGERLRELGVPQSGIDLADEAARITRSAAAAWRS